MPLAQPILLQVTPTHPILRPSPYLYLHPIQSATESALPSHHRFDKLSQRLERQKLTVCSTTADYLSVVGDAHTWYLPVYKAVAIYIFSLYWFYGKIRLATLKSHLVLCWKGLPHGKMRLVNCANALVRSGSQSESNNEWQACWLT